MAGFVGSEAGRRVGIAALVVAVIMLIIGTVGVLGAGSAGAECVDEVVTTDVVPVETTAAPSTTLARPEATTADGQGSAVETAPPPDAAPGPAAEPVATTATLKADHVGATNPGFQSENDDRCPSGAWGWHFVMPTSGTDFLSLTATFANDGPVAASAFYSAAGQVKHAYVFTSGSDTLLGATAQVDGPGTEFNLSHVCVGTPATTSTTSSTSTTSATSTSTTAATSTTSTSAPTPSSIGPEPAVTSTTTSPSPTAAEFPSDCPPVRSVAADDRDDDSGLLARTGADTGWPLALGAVLLVLGGGLVLANRRIVTA